MKRVVIDRFGGPEVLQVVEVDDPRPGPGEVRVRVLASGVSFTDAQLRAGTYLGGPKPPFTPGYELVGIVDELGPGCSRVRVGRPHRRADGVGRQRRARLRAGGIRGGGARGPRPGRGREPRLPLHDRLPAAAPDGPGEARGERSGSRRGRQGGHRRPRARSTGRPPPLRDRRRPGPRRGGAAGRGGDRLSERGLPGPGARAHRRRRGHRPRRDRWRRCLCAPSARCGPADGSSCSAATPPSRRGARTGRG